jgi:hypothetical protein
MMQPNNAPLPLQSALMAMADSLRLAAVQPPQQAVETVRSAVDSFSTSYPAPALRHVFRGMVATTSVGLSRAHVVSAWPAAPRPAPSTFRDSLTGLAWQMTHFESVLNCLGPSPTPASASAARAWVTARSRGVPAEEVEAYIDDMRIGAEARAAFVMRLLHLGSPSTERPQAPDSLARALGSAFEQALGPVHSAVRDLFVRDFRRQAHIAPQRPHPPLV